MQSASDWPNGIISTAPFLLTGNRGEYLKVFGIHSDGRIDREISLVCFQFQNVAGTIDQTPFEARIYHFGCVQIAKLTNQMPLARSLLLHDSSCDNSYTIVIVNVLSFYSSQS